MKKFREQMQVQFDVIQRTGQLFRSSVSGKKIWEKYLESFNDDPIFRDPASSIHNCNHCNNFIRRYGNIIAIDDNNNVITLFDFIPGTEEYQSTAVKLSKLLREAPIQDVFFETFEELKALPYESCKKDQATYKLGIDKNVKRYTQAEAEQYGVVTANQVYTFEHMSLYLDKDFVKRNKGSIESIQADYRDAKNVFKRGMDEISVDTLYLIKDLINQGSLLDGTAHLSKINAIIPYAEFYQNVLEKNFDNWCWKNSFDNPLAKFRNTLIGVLCSELSQGMELNKACLNWNKRVDPANYMKATAPITEKQIKEAKVFVDENGYTASFNRRLATVDDIIANEILHLNSEGGNKQKDVHLFDAVKPSKSTRHKLNEFDQVEEVDINTFMYSILPTCTSVEAFIENNHEDNMVTLTTAKDPESKKIFKWDNNFSWTFNGNLAGKSMIKDAVASQGGKVDGVLRFSIMWADDTRDDSDLDAHCEEQPGNHIYYGNKVSHETGGNLDIDIINPQAHKRDYKKEVVENITYPQFPEKDTKFEFYVKNYSNRNSQGFKAEIEFMGVQFQYEYPRGLSHKQDVKVAKVTYKDGEFTIQHYLQPTEGFGVEKEIYGLKTGQFHKVKLVSLSPNHWGENEVGNKYYFFFLENAQSGGNIRSFHNENLKGDLIVHRKVMEVLANTTMVDSVTNELSGLGFNSTVRDEVILKLGGSHKRVVRVTF